MESLDLIKREALDRLIQQVVNGLSSGLKSFCREENVTLLLKRNEADAEFSEFSTGGDLGHESTPNDEGYEDKDPPGVGSELVERVKAVAEKVFCHRDRDQIELNLDLDTSSLYWDRSEMHGDDSNIAKVDKWLDELIIVSSQSAKVHCQVWLIRQPSSGFNTHSIEKYLRQADTHVKNIFYLHKNSKSAARAFKADLEHLAPIAVAETLKHLGSVLTPHDLEALRRISKTLEEKYRAAGTLIFAHGDDNPDAILEYEPEQRPKLTEPKRLIKLLFSVDSAVVGPPIEASGTYRARFLIAETTDDPEVTVVTGIGTAADLPADGYTKILFRAGTAKISVRLEGALEEEQVCIVQRGKVHCRTEGVDLQRLRAGFAKVNFPSSETLLEDLSVILSHSIDDGHGSIIVIDTDMKTREKLKEAVDGAPGEWFQRPRNLRDDNGRQSDVLTLIQAGCKMDGAVYLDTEGNLHALGCILEGKALKREDRNYGARHRSAARYASTRLSAIAVTLSENGDLSLFKGDRHYRIL